MELSTASAVEIFSLGDDNMNKRQVKSSFDKILAKYNVVEGALYALVALVFSTTSWLPLSFRRLVRALFIADPGGVNQMSTTSRPSPSSYCTLSRTAQLVCRTR